MSRQRSVTLCAFATFAFGIAALSYAFHSTPEDRWARVDDFKRSLPGKLRSANGEAPGFDLKGLAGELARFRVEGMPVCAEEEVTADQYIELSTIAANLSNFRALTLQLNAILESPTGMSDCQFRILQSSSL